MQIRRVAGLGPYFGVLLFAIALAVLHHELKIYHFREIIAGVKNIPSGRFAAAVLITIFSYLMMCGYDALALRYIGHPLKYVNVALASFIGYAFSNNIGLAMVAGGSVRYRLYSSWGLSAMEITKVVAFDILTLWLGFFALGGIVFILEPMMLPNVLHLPFTSTLPLGIALIALVGLYVFMTMVRKTPIKLNNWEISLPRPAFLVPQIGISLADWILAGGVLYFLLPHSSDMTWSGFMGVYLLAQLAGLASQLPGGIGVFETVIITALSPHIPGSAILGSLLVYRGIYYIGPLLLAAMLLGGRELFQKKETLKNVAQVVSGWMSATVPPVFAFCTFIGGAMLLFSGVTPAVYWRMAWMNDLFPLPLMELSHFLGSLVGIMLMLLARSIQRRLDSAYLVTLFLLGAGILFSLLKGFDFEEAIILIFMFLAIFPCRRYFYRKGSLISDRFQPGWIAVTILVLLCSLWLGLFSYKHVEYSNDLWWRFTLHGDAPRFMRAMVGVGGVVLFFILARMLGPSRPKPGISMKTAMEKAEPIIASSRKTYANLALAGDKSFLFNEKENAFIMYGVEKRSWIAMGDPVGPKEEWTELIWRFREMCNDYGGWTVFYEIGPQNLHLYLDMGLTLLKLGEQGRVQLENFSLEGSSHKGLRHTCNKLEKEGCRFRIAGQEEIPSLLPELKKISDAWLMKKNTREKGFSLGFFDEGYVKHFPIGIIHSNDAILGFTNIWTGADKEELSIDLMRYRPDAPQGIMEYLFIQLILWAKQQGFRWFDMGMAPFSGFENHELAPLWIRIGAYIFQYGEHFYNLQGLRGFKEKFDPVWEPRYLASPGGLALPRILTHMASLISGGIKGVVAK
jgi:phosphatidylglycerol lysyltransferase